MINFYLLLIRRFLIRFIKISGLCQPQPAIVDIEDSTLENIKILSNQSIITSLNDNSEVISIQDHPSQMAEINMEWLEEYESIVGQINQSGT